MKKNRLYSYRLGGGIITLNILDNHGLVNVNENKGINPNNISSSETITEIGKYILDATQNNGDIEGSLRNEINNLQNLMKSAYTIRKSIVNKTYNSKNGWCILEESRYYPPQKSIVFAEFQASAYLTRIAENDAGLGLSYFIVNKYGHRVFEAYDSPENFTDSTMLIANANDCLYTHVACDNNINFTFTANADTRFCYFKYIIIPIE